MKYLSSLVGKKVQINRGGPETKLGRLLNVKSDYVILQTEDEGVIYFAKQHMKNVTEVLGENQSPKSLYNIFGDAPPHVSADDMCSTLDLLVPQWVQINRGGPEKIQGALVKCDGDYVTLLVNQKDLVRVHTQHIKSFNALLENANNSDQSQSNSNSNSQSNSQSQANTNSNSQSNSKAKSNANSNSQSNSKAKSKQNDQSNKNSQNKTSNDPDNNSKAENKSSDKEQKPQLSPLEGNLKRFVKELVDSKLLKVKQRADRATRRAKQATKAARKAKKATYRAEEALRKIKKMQ